MNENSKISPDFASIVYFPSKSVSVPLLVPLITTFTPGNGCPSLLDVTLPDILV